MPVDPEYLRQHYASLSDEALLEINREDLVETAQNCYDHEVRQRELAAGRGLPPEDEEDVPKPHHTYRNPEGDHGAPGADDKPGWLEEAAEVYSRYDQPGTVPAPDLVDARNALEASGIPCYLDLVEMLEEKSFVKTPTHRWRLMVPGNFNLHATSVLERDIFNEEYAAEWQTLLETLSDGELLAMTPREAFCGLFDRVERVTKAYNEEIARRRLRP